MFLTPFVAFVAWKVTARAGNPPRAVLIGTACVLVILVGMLVWLRQRDALAPGVVYVPAELQGGYVVPGHAAPR